MSADSNYAYCTLRPLFTEMATSNAITIRNYVRGTGLTGSSTVTYTGDIETAAAGFLGAMDDTIAVFTRSNTLPLPSMTSILAAKETLVTAITNGMADITNQPLKDNLLSAATNAMQRALRKSLAKGFAIPSIIVDRATREVTLYNPGPGPVSIPTVMRSCPAAASITDLSVLATYPEAETAEQAAQCRYSLSWSYNGIAEDTTWIRLTEAPSYNGPTTNDTALLQKLAEFANLYPLIAEDLPKSYTSADGKNEVALAAWASFASIATDIAAAWNAYEPETLPSRIDGRGLIYGLQPQRAGGKLQGISLYVKDAPATGLVLPELFVRNINGKYEQLTMWQTIGRSYEYIYNGTVPADGTEMVAEFACSDLYSPQPVFEVVVARNWRNYINMGLVYQAATSSLQPVPCIEQYDAIDIRVAEKPQSEALTAFFKTLLQQFKETPVALIAVAYTYPLPEHEAMVWPSLPVALFPKSACNDALVAGIAQTVAQWNTTAAPPPDGHFTMKITLFDSQDQPALILHDVIF